MKEQRRNVMVGAFMVAGLAALGIVLVMFGDAPEWLGGAEWTLEIHVTQLRGAPEGTPVNLNGVQVGRVGALKFANRARPDLGVAVIALIKDHYDVPQGAYAVIYKPELGVGRGHIEIVVPEGGAGPLIGREDARIRGEMGSTWHEIVPETLMSGLERTVRQIGDFAAALTPVAEDLHELFKTSPVALVDDPAQAGRVTANLYTVIQRSDQTLKHVNDVFGDPDVKSALRESVENLRQMTEDGKLVVADFRETAATLKNDSARIAAKFEAGIDDTTANIDQLSRKAMPVLDQMAELTANLNRVSLDLADGRGTAGKLLRDDRLYEKLVLLVDRISDMVSTIGRIADKTERQGYLDLAAHKESPFGAVPARETLYDAGAVSEEEKKREPSPQG